MKGVVRKTMRFPQLHTEHHVFNLIELVRRVFSPEDVLVRRVPTKRRSFGGAHRSRATEEAQESTRNVEMDVLREARSRQSPGSQLHTPRVYLNLLRHVVPKCVAASRTQTSTYFHHGRV